MGTGFSLLIRLHLSHPGANLIKTEGFYNVVVTRHALIIIFFTVIPILIGAFGNWLIPLCHGSVDLIFPRLNNLRFWIVPNGLFQLLQAAITHNGIGTG